MRIMITGSRNWINRKTISDTLEAYGGKHTLIHGGARGADRLSGEVAELRGWDVEVFPAKWDKYGKSAGSIRNQEMIDSSPDIVLAFPLRGSRGTFDAIRRAKAANIKTIIYEPSP